MAAPWEIVQRISEKVAAMRRPSPPVSPEPLVRAHSQQPEISRRWRRSRTQRITYFLKRRRARSKRVPPLKRRILAIVFSLFAAILIASISSTASYAFNFYQSALPQVQNLANLQIPQTTRIYDRHGTLLYTLYQNTTWGLGGRSTPVSYNYVPGVLQDAQIAAEDISYWTNNGIDPQGMMRALTQYIQHGGHVAGGGSTITQQLIKNLSGKKDITAQRKMNEIALAIGLTQQYPKWKILEMYFNVTPYGAQEQGVEAATEDYFGLNPQCDTHHNCIPAVAFLDRDLTHCRHPHDQATCKSDPILALARASILAGIPQDPTTFDPSTSEENFQNMLVNRQPYVLDQMVSNGMHLNLGLGDQTRDLGVITSAMAAQAHDLTAKMHITGFQQKMLAPHFVDWVIKNLANTLGNNQNLNENNMSITGYQMLLTGGYNIYTSLDLNLQQFIEKDIKHNLRDQVFQEFLYTYGPLNTMYNVNDSAVVVENAKTGEILAMDGSADYTDTRPNVSGQVNAALAYRQPGSTIKPLVYATALQQGWYPGIKLVDDKTYVPDGGLQNKDAQDGSYTPYDYNKSYHPGLPTDLRISLQNSFNIPAIKALMYSGLDNVLNMARRLGITAIDEQTAAYNAAHPYGHPDTAAQIYGPSFALGTAGIPLVQMVGAYQTFANDGRRVPQHNILDIFDNYGRNLYHYDTAHPHSEVVLSPQVNFLLTDMLSDNYSRHYEFGGTDTLVMTDWGDNHPVAAKTGTTDNFLDNWTLGFTSSIVVGVWSGNADGLDPMRGVIGLTGAGNIWHDVIEYASGRSLLGMHPDVHYPTKDFPRPTGVVHTRVNAFNGLKGDSVQDWVIDGEQPQQTGMGCAAPKPAAPAPKHLDPSSPAAPITNTSHDADCIPIVTPSSSTPPSSDSGPIAP